MSRSSRVLDNGLVINLDFWNVARLFIRLITLLCRKISRAPAYAYANKCQARTYKEKNAIYLSITRHMRSLSAIDFDEYAETKPNHLYPNLKSIAWQARVAQPAKLPWGLVIFAYRPPRIIFCLGWRTSDFTATTDGLGFHKKEQTFSYGRTRRAWSRMVSLI